MELERSIRDNIQYTVAYDTDLVKILLDKMSTGTSSQKECCVGILWHLSVASQCRGRMYKDGAVVTLLAQLNSSISSKMFQERASGVLLNLSVDSDNQVI